MKRKYRIATLWLLAGLTALVLSGRVGDSIFDPRQSNFSFQTFSDYLTAAILLITAIVVINVRE
jgi:hypothetical protein